MNAAIILSTEGRYIGGDTHPLSCLTVRSFASLRMTLVAQSLPLRRSRRDDTGRSGQQYCHPERSEGSRPHRPWSCSLPFFTQVSPVGIDGLDQGNLLCAQPALDVLLPRESSVHIGRFFKVD